MAAVSEASQNLRTAIRRLNLAGFGALALLVGGFGAWAATSKLAGAVIAPGTVVVESNVKKVQHPTGGIVGELLVKEGDSVEAGQVLLRLDDTVTRATLGMVQSQLDELMAREARLIAERDSMDEITFPETLTKRANEVSVATALADEKKLFESRRHAREGQRAQLNERIAQSRQEITGLTAQQEAKEREIKFIAEELTGVSELYDKNLVAISRLMMLQRDKAKLEGARGQHVADIARARGKISETELQILQIDRDFRSEVLKELREAQGKIGELKERRVAAEDQLKRVDVRAPQTGVVLQLAVHTVGGVIGNGETILQIVPRADVLVVDVKVAPQDIDQIALHAKAMIRIMAGNQRTMPDLEGEIVRVSADLTREPQTSAQPGQTYYAVRVSLPDKEIKKLDELHLVPGMPAEAFIQTYARTPMQYLLKPLVEQIGRTFRER